MKQPALVPTLLAVGLAVGSTMALAPGCGNAVTSQTGGTGGTTTATTTASTGGATTTTTSTTNAECAKFCADLAKINCNVLKDCQNDCENHLNAPPDCTAKADALLACWAKNIDHFTCTMLQVLPPPECAAEEKAFNDCVGGGGPDASCICSTGVKVGDDAHCSRKITCSTTELTQNCQQLKAGDPWTCSCFSNGGLLGTCNEPDANTHCSDQYGCCVPLFCAANE